MGLEITDTVMVKKNTLLFLLRFDILGHNKKNLLLTGVKIG